MHWYNVFLDIAVAVGTIGSSIVALCLGLRGVRRKIDATFLWEDATDFQPMLLVQNISSRITVIKSVEIRYGGEKVCETKAAMEPYLSKYSIIEPGEIKRIPMEKFDLKFMPAKDEYRKKVLKIIVKQQSGSKCKFTTRLSYFELCERFFGEGLCG